MLICCSRNISDYYQCWKNCHAALYCCGNHDAFYFLPKNKYKKYLKYKCCNFKCLYEIIIFCLYFYQFNASLLLNKNYLFKKWNLTHPKLLKNSMFMYFATNKTENNIYIILEYLSKTCFYIFLFTLLLCHLEKNFFCVSGMWMVHFECLQFTLMLTDSVVTLPDAEDKKRSNRLNLTGFTANVWSQSQTSHMDWQKLPRPVCPGDGGETLWGFS